MSTSTLPISVTPIAPAPAATFVDLSVACTMCGEPIELSSFSIRSQQTRTACCRNCGLLISAAPSMWAQWNDTKAAPAVDLVERARARRVAATARLILERVAKSSDPADVAAHETNRWKA